MKNRILEEAIEHWPYIEPLVTYPKNDKEADKLISHLDALLKIVGNEENHPLAKLVEVVSDVILSYERARYHHEKGKGIDTLKFLMGCHQLRQSDLPEIASQGVLSEILTGKRALNLRQIKQLSKRFNVDPATFMDDE